MLSKNAQKFINSLKIKKFRQIHNLFLVEGEKSVDELLVSNLTTRAIYCTQSWFEERVGSMPAYMPECNIISEEELLRISDLSTPNKVIAIAVMPSFKQEELMHEDDLILALDGIRDPGNMGTIIRTADWFGIRNIICSEDSVDVYNPKVIQATMGSYARVRVSYLDLNDFILGHQPVKVYGALLDGISITEKKFSENGIIIIGNESKGISPQLKPLITDPIFIPHLFKSSETGYHAESLNASVANAIICYEIRKQLYSNKF